MMPGIYPVGTEAISVAPQGADRLEGRLIVDDLPDLPAVFLAEIGTQPPVVEVEPPSAWMPGSLPVSASPGPAQDGAVSPVAILRYATRPWIGEPSDPALPNVAYLPLLSDAPQIERGIRLLPEDSPRATFQSGEMVLLNEDGRLDVVGGDWTLLGQSVVIRRGPHRAPRRAGYAEFGPVANLRVSSAPLGSDRLTLGLRDASVDLAVPVSTTYAGTGAAEGDSALKGRTRPVLYGYKANLAPVTLIAAELVYQISGHGLAAVYDARDRGSPLALVGDTPDLAALRAATVPASSYATCLAQGLIRMGSQPLGQLTVDAQALGDSSHAGIALDLMTGPGGLTGDRFVAAGFWTALPTGPAGFLFGDGTVEDALNEVLGSCAGWWGSDRLGRICAGRVMAPDGIAPAVTLQRWMLGSAPEEVAGAAPRWRQQVTYGAIGTVQSAADLAGIASEDAALVARYGTASQTAAAVDVSVLAAYPAAKAPAALASGFRFEADALALGQDLLRAHGTRRRRWRLAVNRWGYLVDVGDVIAVDHPRLAGRSWIVVGSSSVGDTNTLELWG